MFKVNCTIVELQIGPDAWVRSVMANGNGTYDVVTRGGSGETQIGFGAAATAACLAVDDRDSMLEALLDAESRIHALVDALRA